LNWFLWRLIVEEVGTLKEIETYYDLNDVLDAHDALDLKSEAIEANMPELPPSMRR
jgi:hypothetical protein